MTLCGRPGCNEPAVATFTFNSELQTVWLDSFEIGPARAGHLCQDHADRLTPPRGWTLEDRREVAPILGRPDDDRAAQPSCGPDVDEPRTPLLARAFRASRRAS